MIQLVNATKFYNIRGYKHYILKDVSYTFPKGKSIGILGRNGAGKSTFLRMLGGLEYPNSGKIITTSSISWPVGLIAGFQGSLTARENIKFVCRIHNKSRREMKQIEEYVYDFAEIGEFFDMPVKSYSSGMRARINFGLSMAFDFDYYLIDEVSGVGDPQFGKKSKAIFEEKKKKACVIVVSHNMKEIKTHCDIAVVLENGKINIFDDMDKAIALYQK
ncbi:ABC transporter ATP-binding protein [Francisella philomiragia]|uniref:Putative capsule polysaccharide export transport system ATP-binding protein n=1 Tax=Francisella philomiragia subsp. philomiragia (strain ATCC 25017 / CCUG 19701 / FSC 153 / O\|nr:ABC transporter ATP-binding protein [Francisella philomiragia]AJI47199.1 ABC transporter family protein [Francisella philomiragia]AJI50064.1 ABC transporter family protein [Francisella philomiragia]MBK2019691.1 ABC transporter ATP-binding protein [Francisella philomiragia]MBK2029523.1 ABC transporter ATP-binding protein [Francisella philomiragia]MBK2264026.1 ABC transporter ATP-binding protein [Francisella philomiragia]